MAQLKDYKQKVRMVLEAHPQARNSDLTLMAHYLHTFRRHLVEYDSEGKPYLYLNKFKEMASPETLIRARRIIQNDDNEFLPTSPAVRKARRIKEENYRNAEVREAKAINYADN